MDTPRRSNIPIIIAVTAAVVIIIAIIILVILLSSRSATGVPMPYVSPTMNNTVKANNTYTQTLTPAEILQSAYQPNQPASAPVPPAPSASTPSYANNSYPAISEQNAITIVDPQGYDRYDFATYEEGDLLYRADLAGRIGDLAALCNARGPECIGFVSNGQLKYKAPDKSEWFLFSETPGDGFYKKR